MNKDNSLSEFVIGTVTRGGKVKKEKRTIQVLRRMTEGDIKSYGGDRWMRRKIKSFIVLAIMCFMWMVVFTQFLAGGAINIVAVIPFMILFVAWMILYFKASNKLWNYIKDKEQPVDLG